MTVRRRQFVPALAAAATFSYFEFYPFVVASRVQLTIWTLLSSAVIALLLSAPLLWVWIAVRRKPAAPWVTRHTATLFLLTTIALATFDIGHSSLGDALAPSILFLLIIVLVVNLVVLVWALAGREEVDPNDVARDARPAVMVFGDWTMGVLLWAALLPIKVLQAAETAAAGQNWCITADGQPVKSVVDLTGWRLRATNSGGYKFAFHGLLVVGSGDDRRYLNWSYAKGRFEPVSVSARLGLHLDQRIRCNSADRLLS